MKKLAFIARIICGLTMLVSTICFLIGSFEIATDLVMVSIGFSLLVIGLNLTKSYNEFNARRRHQASHAE